MIKGSINPLNKQKMLLSLYKPDIYINSFNYDDSVSGDLHKQQGSRNANINTNSQTLHCRITNTKEEQVSALCSKFQHFSGLSLLHT